MEEQLSLEFLRVVENGAIEYEFFYDPDKAHVHPALDHSRRAITNCVNDAAPVRVATMPACFHQRAVRHGARRGHAV